MLSTLSSSGAIAIEMNAMIQPNHFPGTDHLLVGRVRIEIFAVETETDSVQVEFSAELKLERIAPSHHRREESQVSTGGSTRRTRAP